MEYGNTEYENMDFGNSNTKHLTKESTPTMYVCDLRDETPPKSVSH